MEKCRNCGQKTLATLDWACPLCGYPMKIGRRLDKTYAEMLAERRAVTALEREGGSEPLLPVAETPGPAVDEAPAEKISEPEPILLTEDEELYLDQFGSGGTPKLPENQLDQEPPVQAWPETDQDLESADRPLEQPVDTETPLDFQPPVLDAQPAEDAAEGEARREAKPEAEITIEISVEELMEAYQTDDAAADSKFKDSILDLTGLVAMVSIRENRDIQYVNLTGKEQDLFRSIKCMFSSGNAWQLHSLEWGQPVVIKGRFKGSLTAMSLVDCSVIQ